MSWLSQIGGLLQQYANPHENTHRAEQDFEQVSSTAPPDLLAGGLAHAFRSDQTPPFGNMLGQLFGQSNGSQRANILTTLLQAAGPAIASGALTHGGLGRLGDLFKSGQPITPEAADQVSPQAVEEIAKEAEKHDPNVVDRVSDFYSQHPTLVKGLGAAALAVLMSKMAGERKGFF